MMRSDRILRIRPVDLNAARELPRCFPRVWAFRGQPSEVWELRSTLERFGEGRDVGTNRLASIEEFILKNFQGRAHHYLSGGPEMDAKLEWLALLRHHGGPSRLLDVTRSYYAALYFAIDGAASDSIIWAVNLNTLGNRIRSRLSRETEIPFDCENLDPSDFANRLFDVQFSSRTVIYVKPFRVNERMAAQQGGFLAPLDPGSSFEWNLASTFRFDPEELRDETWEDYMAGNPIGSNRIGSVDVVKILIQRSLHQAAREDLSNMNITAATLFPGLDGFARSLWHLLPNAGAGESYFMTGS